MFLFTANGLEASRGPEKLKSPFSEIQEPLQVDDESLHFSEERECEAEVLSPSLNRIKMHSPISRRRKYYIVTNGPFTPYFYFCGMCSMNREMGPQAHIDFSFLGFSSFTTTVRKREMETTLHLMNPSRVIVTSTVVVSFRKATLLGHNVLTCTTQKVVP